MASENYDSYYTSMVERLQRNFQIARTQDRETEERLGGTTRSSVPLNPAALKITGVYFYPEQNAKSHHTDKFELVKKGGIVLRRGQSFFLALRTPARPFDETRDTIKLTFNFGPNPSPLIGTQFNLKAEKKHLEGNENSWSCRIAAADKNAITVEVRSGCDSAIGIWKCVVESRTMYGGGPQKYEPHEDIYLLFNPWEQNDVTYMPDTDLLNEYILEDTGKIFCGTAKTVKGRQWSLGQFESCVLPLVCILLEKSKLPIKARGNPILVSRALSQMVNSNDDNGLLVGKWDGNYGDGQAPASWTGSVPILEKYFSTMRPVKYGQCWVFSGVLCTVARSIGIPTRIVTNFVSAHDANCSLTVDVYFNEKNEEVEYDPRNPAGAKDSIWDDVWMARPDLPKGYGGWQSIDATPQERSEGIFQCGPASLEAVRKGQVGFSYDVPFVLAEVNADLVHWRKDKSNQFGYSRLKCNNYHIGRMVLTKKPGTYDPEGISDQLDIIDEYKDKEGSRAERLSLVNAVRGTLTAPMYFNAESKVVSDVEFDLVELDKIPIGESFAVAIKVTNKASEPRTVQADLSAESMYYNGVRAWVVKKASGKFVVQPNGTEQLKITVTPAMYLNKLVEYGIMKITAICAVDETMQAWCEEDDFQIIKPTLNVEIQSEPKLQKPAQVKFSFKNPLNESLTGCKINYEGPGYTRFESISIGNVEPQSEMKYTSSFIPKSIGTQRFIATFSSKELVDIVGYTEMEVST